jgi:PAS domain S-box-containing protein
MSNMHPLSYRVEKIHGRLSKLYQTANASSSLPAELLPTALLELGIVSEALQLAMKELTQQNEKLVSAQKKVDAEQQRYKSLFELISDGYLVTDRSFTILEVNCTAASLFNVHESLLINKPLIKWVIEEDRSLFQSKLSQIDQQERIDFCVRLLRNHSGFFNAILTVNIIQESDSCVLQWLLRDITEHKPSESMLKGEIYNPCKDRFLHSYCKGENILLEPDRLWLVAKGIVKLTTMFERGEEMLIGLARNSMIFGSSLTGLPTYQAIALSKCELFSISLAEINQSPRLAQFLLPLIGQRLRQTENFLSIYGQIHIKERLIHLLALLKHEIGQPVEEGVRLDVRLTHQDFASACCTTRVTITRLLGKLQQEGKVILDIHNHLILKN